MNSETFTLPQGVPRVVGTWKLDTYRFSIITFEKNNKNLKIFHQKLFFSAKQKISLRKFAKSEKSVFSRFFGFCEFSKTKFWFCQEKYFLMKNVQIFFIFLESINIEPVRVQFSSPNYLRNTLVRTSVLAPPSNSFGSAWIS